MVDLMHAYLCAGLGKTCRTWLELGSCGDDALRLVAWDGQQRRTHRYHVRGLKRERTCLPCILWPLVSSIYVLYYQRKFPFDLLAWSSFAWKKRSFDRHDVHMFRMCRWKPPIHGAAYTGGYINILNIFFWIWKKSSTLNRRRLVLYLRL